MKKFLIAGLGNPGAEYVDTRHNVGFLVIDRLASMLESPLQPSRYADLAQTTYRGKQVLLLKPTTYMNLSGKAVAHHLVSNNIPKSQLLIITDDLNLDFGTLRMKGKGSDGGHNGLKDIQQKLGTTQYPRLRFGIASEFKTGGQVDYVLGKWNAEEEAAMDERIDAFAKAALSFIHHGIDNTMNKFNNN